MFEVEQVLEHLVRFRLDLLVAFLHKLLLLILRHKLPLLLRHLRSCPNLYCLSFFLLLFLRYLQSLGLQLKLLNDPQVLRMFLVLPPLLVLLRLVILDIAPEDSHLLVEFIGEIEVIKLA